MIVAVKVRRLIADFLEQIIQVGLPYRFKAGVVHLGDSFRDFVAFVVNFANQLFQDILHGHQPIGPAVIVGHNGHMLILFLQYVQDCGNFHGAVYKYARMHQFAHIQRLFAMLHHFIEHIPQVQHPDDLIHRVLIHGNTGIMLRYNL